MSMQNISSSKARSGNRRFCIRMTTKQVSVFKFPEIQGLEEIYQQLNAVEAENLFVALLQVFDLRPIESEKTARIAERVAEYLDRAFDAKVPKEIKYYSHLLHMLIKEYDDKFYISASQKMDPHVFLKALLEETATSQKNLVPDCFPSASQVSEFINQKKGRDKLSYEQAVALGKRFHVNPSNFLPLS